MNRSWLLMMIIKVSETGLIIGCWAGETSYVSLTHEHV